MDNNTYVYCTNCENFPSVNHCVMKECLNQKNHCCGGCPCKSCDCFNIEDGRPFSERPNYIESEGN
ncbi:hypothetical protein [Clostridium sp.]|uniref:hypothetical protein n=1 Tax=Clostridium sp. TaxID=1506 RepID=UPI0026101AA2|nr:hypothetical protein [Clostridium sp.]